MRRYYKIYDKYLHAHIEKIKYLVNDILHPTISSFVLHVLDTITNRLPRLIHNEIVVKRLSGYIDISYECAQYLVIYSLGLVLEYNFIFHSIICYLSLIRIGFILLYIP